MRTLSHRGRPVEKTTDLGRKIPPRARARVRDGGSDTGPGPEATLVGPYPPKGEVAGLKNVWVAGSAQHARRTTESGLSGSMTIVAYAA